MDAIAGALVFLAGAVLFAGGAIATAILDAAGRSGHGGGTAALFVGAVVGLIGFVLLAAGWGSIPGPYPPAWPRRDGPRNPPGAPPGGAG